MNLLKIGDPDERLLSPSVFFVRVAKLASLDLVVTEVSFLLSCFFLVEGKGKNRLIGIVSRIVRDDPFFLLKLLIRSQLFVEFATGFRGIQLRFYFQQTGAGLHFFFFCTLGIHCEGGQQR